jgi:hypothetical protein
MPLFVHSTTLVDWVGTLKRGARIDAVRSRSSRGPTPAVGLTDIHVEDPAVTESEYALLAVRSEDFAHCKPPADAPTQASHAVTR